MAYNISKKTKVTSQGDAWGRGRVVQPVYAVAGANDTGTWEDSPNPSYEVNDELENLQKHLKKQGIKSKIVHSESSNVFMIRRWIIVSPKELKKARSLAKTMFMEEGK
jgi:hypothetical protein